MCERRKPKDQNHNKRNIACVARVHRIACYSVPSFSCKANFSSSALKELGRGRVSDRGLSLAVVRSRSRRIGAWAAGSLGLGRAEPCEELAFGRPSCCEDVLRGPLVAVIGQLGSLVVAAFAGRATLGEVADLEPLGAASCQRVTLVEVVDRWESLVGSAEHRVPFGVDRWVGQLASVVVGLDRA